MAMKETEKEFFSLPCKKYETGVACKNRQRPFCAAYGQGERRFAGVLCVGYLLGTDFAFTVADAGRGENGMVHYTVFHGGFQGHHIRFSGETTPNHAPCFFVLKDSLFFTAGTGDGLLL